MIGDIYMETKKWWQSKTVWLGVASTLSGIFALSAEFLQEGKLDSPAGWMLFGVGVMAVIIRVWFTDTPIS